MLKIQQMIRLMTSRMLSRACLILVMPVMMCTWSAHSATVPSSELFGNGAAPACNSLNRNPCESFPDLCSAGGGLCVVKGPCEYECICPPDGRKGRDCTGSAVAEPSGSSTSLDNGNRQTGGLVDSLLVFPQDIFWDMNHVDKPGQHSRTHASSTSTSTLPPSGTQPSTTTVNTGNVKGQSLVTGTAGSTTSDPTIIISTLRTGAKDTTTLLPPATTKRAHPISQRSGRALSLSHQDPKGRTQNVVAGRGNHAANFLQDLFAFLRASHSSAIPSNVSVANSQPSPHLGHLAHVPGIDSTDLLQRASLISDALRPQGIDPPAPSGSLPAADPADISLLSPGLDRDASAGFAPAPPAGALDLGQTIGNLNPIQSVTAEPVSQTSPSVIQNQSDKTNSANDNISAGGTTTRLPLGADTTSPSSQHRSSTAASNSGSISTTTTTTITTTTIEGHLLHLPGHESFPTFFGETPQDPQPSSVTGHTAPLTKVVQRVFPPPDLFPRLKRSLK